MAEPGRPRKCDPKIESLFIDIEKLRNEKVKNTLKEVGIDALNGDARTSLIHSAAYNNIDLLVWLIDQGADINYQDRIGYSALHFAGQNKLIEIAKYLLEKGANPNVQDKHGNTPLWTAIFSEKIEANNSKVIKLLLKYGANPDILNNYGKTPRIIYETFNKKDISTIDLTNF